MASPTSAARCFHHPDRPALAICVSCRNPVCQSCSTPWDGMHHCTSCLAQRRAAAVRSGTALRTAALGLLALVLLSGATYLRAWIGAALVEGW